MKTSHPEQETKLAAGVRANMSRREIIFAACDELLRDGHQVTEAKILSIVRGSSSTVHRYVKEWKELSTLRNQAPAVPSTFLESLNKMFLQLAEDAKEQSKARENELAEENAALEVEKQELEKKLQLSSQKCLELEKSNEHMTANLAAKERDLAETQSECTAREGELRSLKDQIQELKQQIQWQRETAEKQLATVAQQHESELKRLEAVYQRSEDRLFRQLAEQEDQHNERIRAMKGESEKKCQSELAAFRADSELALSEKTSLLEEKDTQIARVSAELRETTEAFTEVTKEHAQVKEGYALVVNAFTELFEVPVEQYLSDKAALQSVLREVKRSFYSENSESKDKSS